MIRSKNSYGKFLTPLIILTLSFNTSLAQNNPPQKAFTLKEKDLIPEGITYDFASKCFYLSSINKHKIVRITMRGKVSDFVSTDQDGIGEVLGMTVDANRKLLFALSNVGAGDSKTHSQVHIYKLDGTFVKKFIIEADTAESRLFNDLAIMPTGDIYITNSQGGSIYHIDKDLSTISLFVKDPALRIANGITLTPEKTALIVSTQLGFVQVNVTTKEITPIPFKDYYIIGIDGLYTFKNSLVGILNVTYPLTLSQFFLSKKGDHITSAEILSLEQPWFDIPTTGVVVHGWLYFIANSQLSNFENGSIKDPSALKETIIGKVKLK